MYCNCSKTKVLRVNGFDNNKRKITDVLRVIVIPIIEGTVSKFDSRKVRLRRVRCTHSYKRDARSNTLAFLVILTFSLPNYSKIL